MQKTAEGVSLTVADTGIGIPTADLDRVFERFYRVDKSHSKEIGGTGLGLSIVKHGAAYHNARVTLESTEGVGTAVTLIFSEHPHISRRAAGVFTLRLSCFIHWFLLFMPASQLPPYGVPSERYRILLTSMLPGRGFHNIAENSGITGNVGVNDTEVSFHRFHRALTAMPPSKV